jgi:hypothetical protein
MGTGENYFLTSYSNDSTCRIYIYFSSDYWNYKI